MSYELWSPSKYALTSPESIVPIRALPVPILIIVSDGGCVNSDKVAISVPATSDVVSVNIFPSLSLSTEFKHSAKTAVFTASSFYN